MTARRQKTRRPPPLSPLARLARFGAVALALGLASCGVMPTGRYSMKSDAKPHSGVVAAHGYPIHGVDISKWQGEVDWAAVKAAGTQVRLHQGDRGRRPRRPDSSRTGMAAKRAGIPRGAYHFVYWCRPADEQARWFKANVPQDPDALPPVLDLEWNGALHDLPAQGVPRAGARDDRDDAARDGGAHRQAADHLHRHHLPSRTSSKASSTTIRTGSAASPPSRTSATTTAAGPSGSSPPPAACPGIDGDVDRNTFYGTENQWRHVPRERLRPRDQARSLEGQAAVSEAGGFVRS